MQLDAINKKVYDFNHHLNCWHVDENTSAIKLGQIERSQNTVDSSFY